jgi:uncharacterized membrane protein
MTTNPEGPEGDPHSHAHGGEGVGGSSADRHIVVFFAGLVLCALLVALLPDLIPGQSGLVSDRAHARIASLDQVVDLSRPTATVDILDGPQKGREVSANLEGPTSQPELPDYKAGDEVLLAIDTQSDGTVGFSVIDRWRLPFLGGLVVLFGLVTVAIAGWRGLRALTSLAITVIVVIRLLIPLLLAGWSPVALAIVLGVSITVLSFVLTQGVGRPTWAAIAGTAGGLLVTGLLALGVTALARFTTAQGSEEVVVLGQLVGGRIDLSGLLLAAVIFGGLGVLNDVAITQAVTLEELHRADPTLGRRALFTRTMNVGIAHLAATVNTLVFAYLGAALPLLVLLALQAHRLDLAINDEHIAVEVVRTIVGAVGVLSAVPLTTAIAAWAVSRSRTAPAGVDERPIDRRLMAHPIPASSESPIATLVEELAPADPTERLRAPRGRTRKKGPATTDEAPPAEPTAEDKAEPADQAAPADEAAPADGAAPTDDAVPAAEAAPDGP